jgi:flagellar protein FliS
MKADPDLANQLLSVYEYMFNRLVEANITDNIEVLHEVEKHLLDLRSAWEEADHQLTISQAEEGKANNAIYASG